VEVGGLEDRLPRLELSFGSSTSESLQVSNGWCNGGCSQKGTKATSAPGGLE